MEKLEQEDKRMGREQANIMKHITRLLQEESLISEEERRKTEQMIEAQVVKK